MEGPEQVVLENLLVVISDPVCDADIRIALLG
jgi:hypothetical protein